MKRLCFAPQHRSANKLSAAQERTLVSLILRIGKDRYRKYKKELGIALDKTLLNLTKSEAHKLISTIIPDLEGRR